jgi:lipoate-protein ligase A
VSWRVERRALSAADFHALEVPDPAERAVWVSDPTGPALVLGSTQPDSVVRPDVDIEVVRRHSGGGAVLVVPGDLLWVDVIVPSGDDLWDDDVGRAAHWLGAVWCAALVDLGVTGEVHTGGLVRAPWSDQVCFAGLGPGEVTVAGRKVVGISQRRTRAAARFQCAALARWDAAALADLLVDVPADAVVEVATGAGAPLDDLLAAFLHHLP